MTRSFATLVIAASLAAFPVLLAATLAPPHHALLLGAAWHPEQWPESRWEEDLRLLEAAHITFTRVAEFTWSRMEPSGGKYDFDWLERAIVSAASPRHDIGHGNNVVSSLVRGHRQVGLASDLCLDLGPQEGSEGKSVGAIWDANSLNTRTGRVR
jgi:hypothetical protein